MTDIVEAVARDIAEENGDDYDLIPKNKSEWNAKQGMFGGRCRDVNEPYQCDYDEMARAAIQKYLRQIREPDTEICAKIANSSTVPGIKMIIDGIVRAYFDHLIAEIGGD